MAALRLVSEHLAYLHTATGMSMLPLTRHEGTVLDRELAATGSSQRQQPGQQLGLQGSNQVGQGSNQVGQEQELGRSWVEAPPGAYQALGSPVAAWPEGCMAPWAQLHEAGPGSLQW